MVPLTLLKEYKLTGKTGLNSNHQSSLFFMVYSTILQRAEDKATSRKEVFEFDLEIRITLI